MLMNYNDEIKDKIAEFIGGNDEIKDKITEFIGGNDEIKDKIAEFIGNDDVKDKIAEFIGNDDVKDFINDIADLVKNGFKYVYEGGMKIIKNYTESEQINLASDFLGLGLDEKNFFINSSSGTLSLENIRDKLVHYGDAVGNLIAYSYMASEGGEIDLSDHTVFDVIIGANNLANILIAGSGGSSLWGGESGDDTLIGGDGHDEFFYTVGNGNDVIQNAASNDIVNLLGVALEQITNLQVNEVAVEIGFNNGGTLRVEGNTGAGFLLGGVTYTVNQSTGVWSTK